MHSILSYGIAAVVFLSFFHSATEEFFSKIILLDFSLSHWKVWSRFNTCFCCFFPSFARKYSFNNFLLYFLLSFEVLSFEWFPIYFFKLYGIVLRYVDRLLSKGKFTHINNFRSKQFKTNLLDQNSTRRSFWNDLIYCVPHA